MDILDYLNIPEQEHKKELQNLEIVSYNDNKTTSGNFEDIWYSKLCKNSLVTLNRESSQSDLDQALKEHSSWYQKKMPNLSFR